MTIFEEVKELVDVPTAAAQAEIQSILNAVNDFSARE